MAQYRWSLPELAAWADSDIFCLLFEKAYLHPHAGIWPDTVQEAPACIETIQAHLPDPQHLLFQSMLLQALLLQTEDQAVYHSLVEPYINLRELGLPFNLAAILDWDWVRIPLALVDEQQHTGHIRFALIGSGPGEPHCQLPDWACRQMDAAARHAVHTAFGLQGRKPGSCFFFWPCLDFTKPGLKIQGASLGLAVYLGTASLLQGLEPPALVCSGQLGPTGLEPSREDALKITAAAHTGFQGFLCVSQGPFTRKPGFGTNSPFEILPVPDLETARMLWACYLPEKGHELLPAIQARYDPPAFAALMDTTPLPLLEFLEKQEQCVSRTIETLIATGNTPAVERLLHTLFALEHRPDRPRRRLDLLLKPLTPERIRQLQKHSPVQAARACRLQLSRCRHLGLVQEAGEWERFSSQASLQEALAAADGWEWEAVLQAAENMVQNQHNRFDFSADMQHLPQQNDCLDWLEAAFAKRKQQTHAPVNKCLGAYYGTLCQHFGFCGPAYLATCRQYAVRALEAFGQGHNQDALQDWRRIHSYLVYACLDAADIPAAEKYLRCFLGLERLQDFDPERANPYEHAAWARFHADAGRFPGQTYWKWACTARGFLPLQHPWQLWYLNLGRISDQLELKQSFWEQSLAVCRMSEHSTLRAMSLLPLAKLWKYRFEDDPVFFQAETAAALRLIEQALCRSHFADLLQAANWRAVLDLVNAQTARFFPFSYR